jgi:hypothetical protein
MVDIHRIVATIDSHHRDFVHKGSIHMGSIIEHNLHMGFVIASLAFLTCPACPTYLAYFIAACLVIMVVVIELLTKINLAIATFQIITKLEVVDHQIDLAELAKLADWSPFVAVVNQIAVVGMGQLAFIEHPFVLLHPFVEQLHHPLVGQLHPFIVRLHPFIVLLHPFAERHLGIITGYIIAAINFNSFDSYLSTVEADHLNWITRPYVVSRLQMFHSG